MPARPPGVSGDPDEFTARIAEARGEAEISPWDAGVDFLARTSVPTVDGRLLVRWHEALPRVVRHAWTYGLPTHAEPLTAAELAAAGAAAQVSGGAAA
jgi:hypothetical protein